MTIATAYLIVLFNASNWGTFGMKVSEYPSMHDCYNALSSMKISNERQNSGVAVVAYCSFSKER